MRRLSAPATAWLLPLVAGALSLGCAEAPAEIDEAATLPDELAAATTVRLVTPPWVFRGESMELKATGAPVGRQVSFFASLALDPTGACPSTIAPLCLGIADPASALGTGKAGPKGNAVLSVVVPHKGRFVEAYFQAAWTGSGRAVTPPVRVLVLDRTGDEDGDGLFNLEERTIGTDLFDADSDDDLWTDLEELGCLSDPLDPAQTCSA